MPLKYVKDDREPALPTWTQYCAQFRKLDQSSMLITAARVTAELARGLDPGEEAQRHGLTHWSIGDVARMSLAWSRRTLPRADFEHLFVLSNMHVNLGSEGLEPGPEQMANFERTMTRVLFQQAVWQRSVMSELARTLLLFGADAEFPDDYDVVVMTPGWFERVTDGISLEAYVEAILAISSVAIQSQGRFSPDSIDSPDFDESDLLQFPESLRRVFEEHLTTTAAEFKLKNREKQDLLPQVQKKYAFNALRDTPFITDVAEFPIAPWVQAIVMKASVTGIYHLLHARGVEGFANDLGAVFQEYAGRHLRLLQGDVRVQPEVRYGPKKSARDSTDWILDLPGVTVWIECKAVQPIESLRIADERWLRALTERVGRGISQINRSDHDIGDIREAGRTIDLTKPRIGLIITLESFYLNQLWATRANFPASEVPIGVISIEDLERLVTLTPEELSNALLSNADLAMDNIMTLNGSLEAAASHDRLNPLIDAAFNSMPLIARKNAASTGDLDESAVQRG